MREPGDVMTDLEKTFAAFEVAWNLGDFAEGLAIYESSGRPFGLADQVAMYHESRGDFERAIETWGHLVDTYFTIGEKLLPFLDHSNEIFLLGSWYASTDKVRARRYLVQYVRVAIKHGHRPWYRLPYKAEALRILRRIKKSELEYKAAGGHDAR